MTAARPVRSQRLTTASDMGATSMTGDWGATGGRQERYDVPAEPLERDAALEVDEVIDLDPPYERHRRPSPRSMTRPRPSRRRLLGLLAAGAVAVAAVAALADYRPAPAPSPAPIAAATASPVPTPSPTPQPTDGPSPAETLSPYWPAQINLPVITVPVDRVLVMANAFDGSGAPSPSTVVSPSPSSSVSTPSGPFVYGFGAAGDGFLPVTDLGRGRQLELAAPLEKGEAVVATASDGTWLLAEVADPNGFCNASLPWRLLAGRLGPDGLLASASPFAELARGVASGRQTSGQHDCPYYVRPCPIATAGGWAAWADELQGATGSVVHVRNLGGGTTRAYATSGDVLSIDMSEEAVAWTEVSNLAAVIGGPALGGPAASGDPVAPAWRLLEADLKGAATQAHEVDLGLSGAAAMPALGRTILDGTAVIASVVGDAGTVRLVRVGADGPTTIDDGGQGRGCEAAGAIGGTVVLVCQWPSIMVSDQGQPVPLSMPVVWTRSRGLRAVAIGDDPPVQMWPVSVQRDWLILYGSLGFKAIPMSALVKP